jgi:flagellar hook-basal body complex protein FliE
MTSPVSGPMGLQQIMDLRQSILDKNQALQNFRAKGPGAAEPAAGAVGGSAGAGEGFADTLRTALDKVNASQQRASDISAAYERGEETDVAKVMLARQEASVSFEATLQVRNKLLSAYLDILKMGV